MGKWYYDPKQDKRYFATSSDESIPVPPHDFGDYTIKEIAPGDEIVYSDTLLDTLGIATPCLLVKISTTKPSTKPWPSPATYEVILKAYPTLKTEGRVGLKDADLFNLGGTLKLKHKAVAIRWEPGTISFNWSLGLTDPNVILAQYLGSVLKFSIIGHVWGFTLGRRKWMPIINEMTINLNDSTQDKYDLLPIKQLQALDKYVDNITPQDVAAIGLSGNYPQFIPTYCNDCLDVNVAHILDHVMMNDLSFYLMFAAASEFLPKPLTYLWGLINQCRTGGDDMLKWFLPYYRAFFLESFKEYLVLSSPNYGQERMGWHYGEKKKKHNGLPFLGGPVMVDPPTPNPQPTLQWQGTFDPTPQPIEPAMTNEELNEELYGDMVVNV